MNMQLPPQKHDESLCDICGNEIRAGATFCPFCNHRQSRPGPLPGTGGHRLINLERGLPPVDMALKRLELEIVTAHRQGIGILTIIHGYGSSGKGGKIRREVRRQLEYMKTTRRIRDFVIGEEFRKRAGKTARLLRRFPYLSTHTDLNRTNRGITLVVI